jgi:hypothetical protein
MFAAYLLVKRRHNLVCAINPWHRERRNEKQKEKTIAHIKQPPTGWLLTLREKNDKKAEPKNAA